MTPSAGAKAGESKITPVQKEISGGMRKTTTVTRKITADQRKTSGSRKEITPVNKEISGVTREITAGCCKTSTDRLLPLQDYIKMIIRVTCSYQISP